jgi:hypothetical protein
LGAHNLENIEGYENDVQKENHLELVEALKTEVSEESSPKINFLSVLFTLSLSITSFKLFSAAYYTLKSLYTPDVFVAMTLTFNELYQKVVFGAYCFEIGLSAIFASLYVFNFYSAIMRKKRTKNLFLFTQGSYLTIITTYNVLVNQVLGSQFQTGLVVSNLIYLALWGSYLVYSDRAKTVFVRA